MRHLRSKGHEVDPGSTSDVYLSFSLLTSFACIALHAQAGCSCVSFLGCLIIILILKIIFQYSVFKVQTCGGFQKLSFLPPRWRLRDSNSRPPACKAGALPTELSPHGPDLIRYALLLLLGLSGLEPPTSRLSGVRSNRLSYKPLYLAASCSPIPSPV